MLIPLNVLSRLCKKCLPICKAPCGCWSFTITLSAIWFLEPSSGVLRSSSLFLRNFVTYVVIPFLAVSLLLSKQSLELASLPLHSERRGRIATAQRDNIFVKTTACAVYSTSWMMFSGGTFTVDRCHNMEKAIVVTMTALPLAVSSLHFRNLKDLAILSTAGPQSSCVASTIHRRSKPLNVLYSRDPQAAAAARHLHCAAVYGVDKMGVTFLKNQTNGGGGWRWSRYAS